MAVVDRPVACAHRRTILTSPPTLLIGALGLAVTLWRIGIGEYPGLGVAIRLARSLPDISPSTPADAEFLMWSPPGMLLAAALGVFDRQAWMNLHLAVLALGMTAVFAQVRQAYGRNAASLSVATFFACSLPVVLFGWAGSSDPFTVVAGSFVALSTGPGGALASGVLLGFSSFEQGVAVVASLAVLAATGAWGRVRLVAWSASGLLLGKVAVELFARTNGATHDRRWWAENVVGYDELVAAWWRGMPVLLGTVFASAWLLFARRVWTARPWWPWLVALAPPLAASMIAVDETRVAAITVWPALLAAVVTLDRDEPECSGVTTWGVLAVTVLVPAVFVAGGGLQFA